LKTNAFGQGWVYFPCIEQVPAGSAGNNWVLIMRLFRILARAPLSMTFPPKEARGGKREAPGPKTLQRSQLKDVAQCYRRCLQAAQKIRHRDNPSSAQDIIDLYKLDLYGIDLEILSDFHTKNRRGVLRPSNWAAERSRQLTKALLMKQKSK
jgi:hypothetical protein